jgi:hypothetical protein
MHTTRRTPQYFYQCIHVLYCIWTVYVYAEDLSQKMFLTSRYL